MSDAVQSVFDAVAATAPEIRGALPTRRTAASGTNPSGETQLAADVYADRQFEARLSGIDAVGTYASEEREEPIDIGGGSLSVAIDPLDGSSNLRSNNSMGTIVGIYDGSLPAPGRDLVGACYVLYGPITTMVAATDGTVREELLDDGERSLLSDDLRLPEEPTVYGFGGRVPEWDEAFRSYVREIESELKLRYGGAMVGDVNQVVTYGGIFSYPSVESAPNGKLRALFEAAPMGYVVEAAGGASSNGDRSLLEIGPESLHERTPVHLGNRSLIDRLEAALR